MLQTSASIRNLRSDATRPPKMQSYFQKLQVTD